MIRPIVKESNPVLHRKTTAVPQVTPEIQELIDSMIETMHAAEGVGLAANQIGVSLSILVASADGKKGRELVLLNPTLIKREGRHRSSEGCLSLPGISAEVSRSAKVAVTGLDREGKGVRIEAEGLLAKILQHEVDHLEGHLFPERVGFWERRRLMRQYASLCATLRQVQV
jgi:peptide deformylase